MTRDRELHVNLGPGAPVAIVALVAAGLRRRRSPRLLVLALVGVGIEVVFRRWLARSQSNLARRLTSRISEGKPSTAEAREAGDPAYRPHPEPFRPNW